MKTHLSILTCCLATACSVSLYAKPLSNSEPVSIDAAKSVAVDTDAKTVDDYDALIKSSANHPNELYRIYAAKASADGEWADAARLFRKSARYADKYSQHRLSLLYWHGVGVPSDHVEAYVWADLAAERGYPQFLALREKMWGELNAEEQAAVPARGKTRYAEYGDPIAKKRFATALAQGKRNTTGSHTGFFNHLSVVARGVGPSLFGDGPTANLESMYDASRTDPDKYWAFEDYTWKHVTVTVGDIQESSQQKTTPTAPPKP